MTTTRDGPNAFQRAYFAWAAPHYARMTPTLRHEVECLDRWLYSRAGMRFWLTMAAVVCCAIVGLRLAGMSWAAAVPGALASAVVILFVTPGAWLQPERYTGATLIRLTGLFLLLLYLGAASGLVLAHVLRHGAIDVAAMLALGTLLVTKATPVLLLMLATFVLLMWSIAAVRRFRIQRELAGLRAAREAETLARQLAEARLKLLQNQIQPHFVFNTLAAIQHWVDEADPRAGPLLAALTSFLRGSTELLGRAETTLAVELETVRHYLSITQARLGKRLQTTVSVDERAAAHPIPPGLVLTLVENAIEHGLAPAMAGGTLRIAARDDGDAWILTVGDDGVGLTSLTLRRVGGETVAEARVVHGPAA